MIVRTMLLVLLYRFIIYHLKRYKRVRRSAAMHDPCAHCCRRLSAVERPPVNYRFASTINRQSHTMKYKLLLFIKNNGEQGATCFGS